jgi:hypothetical protein
MRRWVQIQPDDIRRLRFKVRVISRHVAIEPLRLQTVLGPDPRYHHVADSKLSPEFACAPLGRAIRGFALERPLEDPRFERRREGTRLLPGVPAEQPRQPFLTEAFNPAVNESIVAVQLVADCRPRMARLEQQDQSRPACIIGTTAATRGSLIKLHTFRFRQYDRVFHTYDHTPFSCVTVH